MKVTLTAIKKLVEVDKLTVAKKFAKVTLKTGEVLICKADCFGEEEDGTSHLLVMTWDDDLEYELYGEYLFEKDIESVEEYQTNKTKGI